MFSSTLISVKMNILIMEGNVMKSDRHSPKEAKSVLEEFAESVVSMIKSIPDEEKRTELYLVYHPTITPGGEFGVSVQYKPGQSEQIQSLSRNARLMILTEVKPLFQELKEIVGSVFLDDGSIGAYHYLERLINHPEKKQEIIQTAYDEIMQVPTDWRCIVFLNGLVSKIRYSIDGVTIRLPVASDFKTFRVPRVPNTQPNIPSEVKESTVIAVSSVLEFMASGIPRGYHFKFYDNYQKIVSMIEKEIEILRLAVGGKWKYSSWFAETDHVLYSSSIDNRLPVERFLLKLGVYDYSYFKEEHLQVYDLVRNSSYPEYITRMKKEKNLMRVARALKMLNEASQRPTLESILFSIIGLETILQRESPELRFTLSTRVAILLECLGCNRSEVFSNVYEGYKIRNDFVHGNEVDEDKASELSPKLLESLRLSILMLLDSDCKTPEDENNLLNDLGKSSMQIENLKVTKKRLEKAVGRYKEFIHCS